MNHTEQLDALATALSKAQAGMENAKKDASNPFFKSKYADLASVWDSVRAPLTSNGLAVIQTVDCDDAGMYLVTKLIHLSGQWVDSRVRIKPVKDDPQGLGSAITYMRRYALQAMVGVAPEEDDGNAASGMGSPQIKSEQKTKKQTDKASAPSAPPASANNGAISTTQAGRLYTRANKAGYTNEQVKEILISCGYASSKDIPNRHYDTIVESIENSPVEQIATTKQQLSTWVKGN